MTTKTIGEGRRRTGTIGIDLGNGIGNERGTEIEIEERIRTARTEILKGIIEIEIVRSIRGVMMAGEMINLSVTVRGLPDDRHREKIVVINSGRANQGAVVADKTNTEDGKKKEKGTQ